MRHALPALLAACLLAASSAQLALAQSAPEASNMRLVGSHDLQARSAYQPTIHRQGDRWILYVGHHGGTTAEPKPLNPITGQREFNGTSILDVTDPAKPVYLAHVPGEAGLDEDGGAQMVRVCDGRGLKSADPAAFYMLRTQGNAGHQVFDVSDPAKPRLLARIPAGHTHKNWWECDTGIAYLVSGNQPPWRVRRMTQVFDLNDPTNPKHIRDFGLPGQQIKEGETPSQQHGEHGAIPTELHGGISTGPAGNRIYFGYGTNSGGIVQIVDRRKLIEGPAAPTDDNLRAPEVGRLVMSPLVGAHTAYPLPGMPIPDFARDAKGATRDMLMIVDEALKNECRDEARQMVWFADITVESQPMVVSNFTCLRPRAISARAAGGSARTPRTRAWRRSSTGSWPSSPGSMPGSGRWTSATPIGRARSASTSRRSPRRPCPLRHGGEASRAASGRSRPTTSSSTSAAMSISSTGRIPGCISWR